jgi:BCD family chlorophyll transporter-like MFS transporter
MKIVAKANRKMLDKWKSLGPRYLPFADAATEDLPLGRLMRLSMFQWSIGMAAVLLTGTLNRVMIVELGVPTSLVALMVAIPVLAAPFRALIGHRSDTYKSALGVRRVPYIWLGTILQFGGLAIMPFALLLLQSQTTGPEWAGPAGALLAFLLTGLGMHMAQTAGLALATDLSAEENRPRVVALMYVMLLVGMLIASIVFAILLRNYSPLILIKVVQGAAVVTVVLNVICLWKQEPRNPVATRHNRQTPRFSEAFAAYRKEKGTLRLLVAVALGSAAFSMQDVLLEPYGGEVLKLSVSQTTLLTAIWAAGTLIGFAHAGRALQKGANMYRLAALGLVAGITGFSAIIFSEPLHAANLFRTGAGIIGFGGGLFAVCTMLAAMDIAEKSDNGLAIGAWGAVQATAIGHRACRRRPDPRRRQQPCGRGRARRRAQRAGCRVQRCLPPRNRAAVCGARGSRAARRPPLNPQSNPEPSLRTGRNARLKRRAARREVMETGAITGYIDVAQVTLYAFWVFFALLLFYIRQEDRREGYPLEADQSGAFNRDDWLFLPPAKTFLLPHGHGEVSVPNDKRDNADRPVPGAKIANFSGAPYLPTGDNPMLDSIGPGSWAERSDTPDLSHDGKAKIVPLRVASDFGVAEGEINPVGCGSSVMTWLWPGPFPMSGWTVPNRCCAISKSPRKWAMHRGRSWRRSISASSVRPRMANGSSTCMPCAASSSPRCPAPSSRTASASSRKTGSPPISAPACSMPTRAARSHWHERDRRTRTRL